MILNNIAVAKKQEKLDNNGIIFIRIVLKKLFSSLLSQYYFLRYSYVYAFTEIFLFETYQHSIIFVHSYLSRLFMQTSLNSDSVSELVSQSVSQLAG